MLSTNAFGSTGPWSRWLGYGPIVRCVSGIASLWRYPEDELAFGEPTTLYPDHYGARVCATAVLAALIRRRRTARGAYLEVAQAELIVNQLADVFLAASLGEQHGDRWGVYPCAGDDEWCVITVRDDAQWRALRRVVGDPGAEASATADRAPTDLLDRHLSAWTRTLPPRAVMERLQAAGVPAAMMMRPGRPRDGPAPARRAGSAPSWTSPASGSSGWSRARSARARSRRSGSRPLRSTASTRARSAPRCSAWRSRRSTRCSRPASSRSRCPCGGSAGGMKGQTAIAGLGMTEMGKVYGRTAHGLRGRGARARARRRGAGEGRRRRAADQRQPLRRDGADAADVARARGPDARQCDERLRLERRGDAAVRRARDRRRGRRTSSPACTPTRRCAPGGSISQSAYNGRGIGAATGFASLPLRLRRLRAREHELRARVPPAHAPVRHDARPARDDRRRPARVGAAEPAARRCTASR